MPSVASHNNDNLETLLGTLQHTLGVIIPEEQRADMLERIQPVLTGYKLDSPASLAEAIQGRQSEDIKAWLLDVISQSQSSWELSGDIKAVLHGYIFEQLPYNARVWIVGCGQGQLAYAVAMEAANYEHESGNDKELQFIATDISPANIDFAEQATYSTQQLSGLSEENKKLFVTMNETEGQGQIKDKIRQLVSFSHCDLTHDFQSQAPVDLIICPDMLVYFSNDIKTGVVKQFSDLLKSGGIFLTDNNQAVMSTGNILERVEHPAGIFYRKVG